MMVDYISNARAGQDASERVVHVRSQRKITSFSGTDKRQWRRRRIIWMGKMQIGGYEVDVRVCDISLGGAKIQIDLPLKEGASVVLMHKRFGQLEGHVVWQSSDELGLRFDAAPSEIAEILGPSAVTLGLAD